MAPKPQRPKGRSGALSDSLAAAIDAINLAKEASSLTPAKVVFGTVSILLTMIRDTMINKLDYVELGLACADVCKALASGMDGRSLEELNPSVLEAIEHLTKAAATIQEGVNERGRRNALSRLAHSKSDKEAIIAWKQELARILQVFNTQLNLNNHVILSEMRRTTSVNPESGDGQYRSTQPSVIPGELPPPAPRDCFGRAELIEDVVSLAENFTPVALIGPGGIGKTHIALKALHDCRIKQRFGDNRWFIRCDQFPASHAHFLSRLSDVIGAGTKNIESLAPLRPFLSTREMIIILDNVDLILDPQGTDAQQIYATVEELSQIGTISLFLTSRISTVPPGCKHLEVPTLSSDAASQIFHSIYDRDKRRHHIDNILEQLDFHPLSVTLLAAVAQHSKWDTDRLTREWKKQRTSMLHTKYKKSLAATIELSLASAMFQELGPDARDLLGVVAFFPQGIDEDNLDWFFPTIPNRTRVFDDFCILSLTFRSNGFITMLAPLRDYLRPKDPNSSKLLCTAKDNHFIRLTRYLESTSVSEEGRWIRSEDVNIEHLLDAFTSTDEVPNYVWSICGHFLRHILTYKPRPVVLALRCEELPDDHPSKPECLFWFGKLVISLGKFAEGRRIATHALNLWRERKDDYGVARTLEFLCEASCLVGSHKEGIKYAEEAREIYARLGDVMGLFRSLCSLATTLCSDGDLAAAEEVASAVISIIQGRRDQRSISSQVLDALGQSHGTLGQIYHSRGEFKKAREHLEVSLEIASSLNSETWLFHSHFHLARLSNEEGRFGDVGVHIERAKSYAENDKFRLGCVMEFQAWFLGSQGSLEVALTEGLQAIAIFKELGALQALQRCLQVILSIIWKMRSLDCDPAGIIITFPEKQDGHSLVGIEVVKRDADNAPSFDDLRGGRSAIYISLNHPPDGLGSRTSEPQHPRSP